MDVGITLVTYDKEVEVLPAETMVLQLVETVLVM